MRYFLLFVLTSLFQLIIIYQAISQTKLPYVDDAWSKPYEPFRIAGNIYYVGTHDLACYLIATNEGNILINTGLVESVPLIRKSIETLGFKFSDIKILLTTQGHYDHVAGMAEIKKLTGAKMIVQRADSSVLADGGNSDFIFGGKGPMFPPVAVDKTFIDHETITLGSTKLVALHHPGHTKGSTSFMIETKDEKRSWKLLILNVPSILSETRIFGMPSYPNVGKDYRYTIAQLKDLQFDLWVASHASQFSLHDKRKPGEAYRPEVFADRPGFEATVSYVRGEYEKRMREK